MEGLADGRAAYVMHAHHVFMDGLALARLHERVLNMGREHQPDKPTPLRKPVRHSPIGVAAEQLAYQIAGTPKALFGGGRAVIKAVGNLRSTADYVSSWRGWLDRRHRTRPRSCGAGPDGCGASGPWNANSMTYDGRLRRPADAE